MRGLKATTILLATVMGPTLTLGAPPESGPGAGAAAPPSVPSPEKAPEKATALDYLKAGAHLYNKGELDKASRYFQAASRFRSQLSPNEEVVLEVYLEELENQTKKLLTASTPASGPAAAPAPAQTDAAVTPAATTSAAPTSPLGLTDARTRAALPTAAPAMAASTATAEPLTLPNLDPAEMRGTSRYDTTDPKQRARWLLNEAREQMGQGHYDAAAQKIAEAKALDVKWHFLEETPDKTAKLLEKVKARSPNGPSAPAARALGVRTP